MCNKERNVVLMFVYLFEIDAKLLGYVLFHYLRFLLLLLFRGGNTWQLAQEVNTTQALRKVSGFVSAIF